MRNASVHLERRSVLSRGWRYALAGVGMCFVGIGGVGVFVPGLPTTIFLIFASACFARSCPWLEDRLLRNRFFEPYMRYINGQRRMSRRTKITSIAIMWLFVSTSVALLIAGGSPLWIALTVVAAAAVGTGFIIHWNPRPAPSASDSTAARECPAFAECANAAREEI